MQNVQTGSLIGIPCKVSDSAFDGEVIVEFDSLTGWIAGFARAANVRETDAGKLIEAEIISVEEDHLVVNVDGSFFTTNGIATIQPDVLPLAA